MKLFYSLILLCSCLASINVSADPMRGGPGFGHRLGHGRLPPPPPPFFPGRPTQPLPPRPQPFPPPQPVIRGEYCLIEYTGSYYYVSKNGTRFGDLTSSLSQVIANKQQLESSGICAYSQAQQSCQIEYTGSYYYVSRAGTRFSDMSSNLSSVLAVRDQLYQSRNCSAATYQPTSSCSIEYTGSYYYVARDGTRFGDMTSNLAQATATRDSLVSQYVCQAQYVAAACRLEYTGSYYYISINGNRSTDMTSNLNQALNQQSDLAGRGLCSLVSSNERCSLEYTGSYYYVARDGTRISDMSSNMSQVSVVMGQLQSSRNCY